MELLPTLWIKKYKIKNEAGIPLDFHDHPFLWDIYNDFSPLQVILKPPQIGATVMMILKALFVAKKKGRDIIYTLPTQTDVTDMGGGKVNRLIAQNPILKSWVKDHDTIEQKSVGDNIIYFRGTWSNKQAMMVSSQLNIHDEVDASKQDVIERYETRQQAQMNGWRWYFSHPSIPMEGVDRFWPISDQKHWFITCGSCEKIQYLSWPESIDTKKRIFICKYCTAEITDDMRRKGKWVAKYKKSIKRPFSGYWISQMMYARVSAGKIIDDFNTKPADYFWNMVLGLPYIGSSDKVTQDMIFRNLTDVPNDMTSRVVIGVDPGSDIRYVAGNLQGIFKYGECKDYTELDAMMKRWPRAIMLIDQGGEQIGDDMLNSRKLREKYPGRVFLVHYAPDRKTMKLIRWGAKDEDGYVLVDRNRMIQLVIEEFADKRIPLNGNSVDFYDYWLHWSHIYRVKEEDNLGGFTYKWERRDRDDWVHATVYWRVGMSRFMGVGSITAPQVEVKPNSYMINEDQTVSINLKQFIEGRAVTEDDWRDL